MIYEIHMTLECYTLFIYIEVRNFRIFGTLRNTSIELQLFSSKFPANDFLA